MKLTKSQLRQIIREEMVKNTLNKSIKSVNEQNVYIDFLNKAKGFKKDRKIFKGPNAYDLAVKWAKKNFDNFNPDMIKFESVNEAKLKSIIRSVIKEEMQKINIKEGGHGVLDRDQSDVLDGIVLMNSKKTDDEIAAIAMKNPMFKGVKKKDLLVYIDEIRMMYGK